MQHHQLKVARTAHFYSLGTPNPTCKEVWIACHGYGQNAEDFLKNFEVIANAERWIIAPEGLSRFYWGGFTGPIASSWMTSKDRLAEIDDFCNWLDELYDWVTKQFTSEIRITLFGFSQGTATIMRWIQARQPKYQRLILWAGLTPEDISYEHLQNKWPADNCWLVYGTQDRFLTEERITWQQEFINEQQLPFQFITFDGKHKVDGEALKKLVNG